MLKFFYSGKQGWLRQCKQLLCIAIYGISIILVGCSANEGEAFTEKGSVNMGNSQQMKAVKGTQQTLTGFQALAYVSSRILDDLVQFNQGLFETQLIVVTTPVFLNELTQTNPLGLALQDSLMTGLQQRQFTVIDANMSHNIQITPTGDFMLSRDWKQLPASLMVDHALVSTMSVTSEGVILNVRLLNIDSRRLVSSAQAFFSDNELAGWMPFEFGLSQQEATKKVQKQPTLTSGTTSATSPVQGDVAHDIELHSTRVIERDIEFF
ncbi:FlgO family outer membrane protein [uncultured Shewanella sp.]|uniref:FlgO family outer membrane protein n=1 Tax=uncultured Shewanella sp. TaxID=173975 RepID=UPI0026038EBD|nr:FlgO family outer membrane protein [uncultured Shewanella sp.]